MRFARLGSLAMRRIVIPSIFRHQTSKPPQHDIVARHEIHLAGPL